MDKPHSRLRRRASDVTFGAAFFARFGGDLAGVFTAAFALGVLAKDFERVGFDLAFDFAAVLAVAFAMVTCLSPFKCLIGMLD